MLQGHGKASRHFLLNYAMSLMAQLCCICMKWRDLRMHRSLYITREDIIRWYTEKKRSVLRATLSVPEPVCDLTRASCPRNKAGMTACWTDVISLKPIFSSRLDTCSNNPRSCSQHQCFHLILIKLKYKPTGVFLCQAHH